MDLTGRILNNKYKIMGKIGEGGMSTVWLAEDVIRRENVAVKVLKKHITSNRVEDIIRFKNEAVTVAKLNTPDIVKIFEIGEMENNYYIIMEYIKGKSLYNMIEEGIQFVIDNSVDIIYKVCEALKYIHGFNIIHRDLKPGNVIINYDPDKENDKLEIKLIDFGLAQVKEFNIKDTNEIMGTLSYMAPEQVGLIKKSVDERSDLYSVGIIFYQLLTNELPFKADSINSIIHQQIAKVPEQLTKYNPLVPVILEKIVLKLLEKEPEKRYQSVAGLLSDLDKYKKGQADFILGLDDKIIKLNFRSKLIGRDEEFGKLKEMFHRALNGKGGLCFIGGEAGRGKTRLVQEFRNYVYEKKAVFIDGKCFSGKNKIPYGPFKDALNVYITNFNKRYSRDDKIEIKQRIKDEIGDFGGIILKLSPVMEEIIGDSPPLVELDPVKENKRFLMVLSKFFSILGRVESTLVIMLDDLQWCDEGSFELLNELAGEISKYPVLIIGTYRDNEITEEHGLQQLTTKALDNAYPMTQIELKAFDLSKMNRFISGLLFDTEANTREVSNFILQKSKGNPFFAIEILKQLINEKAIIRKEGQWYTDKDILNKTEISSTIVDILIKKISLLGDKEINILSYAAVIGRKFDMDLLFTLSELNMEDIIQGLDKAVQLQLLEEDLQERGKVLFAHDRIKEAFYKNIGENKKRELHLKTARTLEDIYKDDIDKVIFDLAYHYIESDDKNKILEFAYPAAIKARQNYANEEAVKYFKLVIDILEERGQKGNERWVECVESIAEICLTFAKTDDAIKLINELLPFIQSKLKKAKAFMQISNAYYKKGDYENCEKYGILGLEALGEKPPVKKWEIGLCKFKENILRTWYNIFPVSYSKGNNSAKSEETKQIIWQYFVLCASYSLSGRENFVRTVLRMVNLSERRIGKSKELGLSMMIYALYLAEIPKFKQAIKFHQKALELRKELNDEWGIAQCYCNMGYYYKCKGEYRKSIECFDENIKILKKVGDLGEIGAATSALAGAYLNLADYENAKAENDNYCELTNKLKSVFGTILVCMHAVLYYTEMGNFELAENNGVKAYKLAKEAGDSYLSCMLGTMLGRLYCEKSEIDKSIEYLEEAKDLYEKNRFLKEYTTPLFPFLAEAYIAQFNADREIMSEEEEKRALDRIKNACSDALDKTKHWVTFHMNSIRVTAKYHMMVGNKAKAEKLFKECIKMSEDMERKYELALGFFEYGKFLAKNNNLEKSRENYEAAYNIFKTIGSKVYEKRVADLLGIDEENTSSIERSTKELRYNQRLSSILVLTQEISSILDLDMLLERLMTVAIEVTGAQRGYIMIKNSKTGEIVVKVRKNINGNEIHSDSFSKSIVKEVMEKGETILTINAMEDERYRIYQSVLHNELKSVLCMPLKYNNEISGVCYLDNTLSSSVFTEEVMDALKVILNQAAISIENAKLYKLAVTDGLTELVTIKHFLFLLDKELEQVKRYNHELSLIMFDIDHFKSFNDNYGHQAGDQVLANISRITRDSVRIVDTVGRYGGEEFIVMLPETDSTGAEATAERIRKNIECGEIPYGDNILKVTVSLGVSTFPHHAMNSETLIKVCDDALYVSKESGRNRVTMAKSVLKV